MPSLSVPASNRESAVIPVFLACFAEEEEEELVCAWEARAAMTTTRRTQGTSRTRQERILQSYATFEQPGFPRAESAGDLLARLSHAARPITGCVQCAQRRASMGISLRHSGHFLVVGSGGFSPLCMRATSAFTGVTTKK